ncbi:hypothetical protein OsI_05180 [Oryza sativa Indica Group]|uniref:Uncharacterized protein n=1 Tax=Oryza sativa subsp. indica TaxID=39946 RepID=B8A950_ORYSI|nr:hypothetical protein OsI_05180 [Oryza sativa Indica Group]
MARRQGVASMLTIALIIGAFASAPTSTDQILSMFLANSNSLFCLQCPEHVLLRFVGLIGSLRLSGNRFIWTVNFKSNGSQKPDGIGSLQCPQVGAQLTSSRSLRFSGRRRRPELATPRVKVIFTLRR